MKNAVISIVFALTLASCATYQNPVTATNLYQTDLAYDGALKTFNKMKDLCVRRVISSQCRTYVIKAQAIIPKVEDARQVAETFIIRNPTIDATSVISAYTIAVDKFGVSVTSLSKVQ